MKRNQTRKTAGSARLISLAAEVDNRIGCLKQRILRERLTAIADPELRRGLELAVVESMALAYTTPFPLLVLPALLDEGFRATQARVERQQLIRARTRSTVPVAA